jgi:antitoxin ParD1/3/4
MPDVHLTAQMQDFADRLVAQGAYADLGEVVRAGMRRLMEERGAAAFHALNADLNAAADELERGGGTPFDPRAWGKAPE